ncbi:MAG: repressor LexA [Phycisphaerae bacterium]|nr:repressor LexA [Phycisphaerae bacterium]
MCEGSTNNQIPLTPHFSRRTFLMPGRHPQGQLNLTPRQLDLLRAFRTHRMSHACSPTMQELADVLGVSKVTVHEHVKQLVSKGVLTQEPNRTRSLALAEDVVLPDEERSLSFPLVGRVAAGLPIEACAQSEQLDLEDLFGPRIGEKHGTFALEVRGESMRDEGILDGDYVLVERRQTARNGERVIALIGEDEVTLKTYFKEADGMIRLQPANPDFAPIMVRECVIQGVVIGVMRRY